MATQLKQKLAGFEGIVRHRKREHGEITQRKPTLMAIDTPKIGHSTQISSAMGPCRHPHLQAVSSRHRTHAPYVVAVFMGNQNSVKGLRIGTQHSQTGLDLPRRKTAVDQQADLARLQQQGVTPATAP
jgi:hypothetical protein